MADRKLDDYKPLKFYQDKSKVITAGFESFQDGNDYYFCRYVDNKIALISQAYTSAAGRDNGIESVKKNEKIAKRYTFEDRAGGKYGFALKAGNHQEIAVSPSYAKSENAEHVQARLTGDAKVRQKKAPGKAKMVTAATPDAPFTEDDARIENYKAVNFYEKNGGKTKDGFDKFEKDGAYYFSYRQAGKIALISESYTSEAGRDNGIKSVKSNMKNPDRYRYGQQKNGKHYFDLKAANHQEIGTSPKYSSKTIAANAAKRLRGEMPVKSSAAKKAAPKKLAKKTSKPKSTAAFTAADKRIENYKPLAFYKEHGGSADGFNSFDHDGAHYFHFVQDNEIVLISESYTSQSGRNNGIKSVKKNMKLASAYQHHKHKNGKHYFDINAANHQEIATSRWYSSDTKARQGAANLRGEKSSARTSNVEQNYMPLAFYQKATTGQTDGFETFQGDDGEHYFVYFEDSKIALISEGYPTAAIRDKGMASVEKNMKTESRYVFGKGADGKDGFALRAGNNKEIARSVSYGTAAAAAAGAAILYAGRQAKSANVEQNYQPLAFYEKATDGKEEGFETFKGDDGEHYFAYFEDGKIALISEGYPTAAIRDKGMASVEKNMKTESRYVFGKGADGKEGFVLRAGNNKEIARSVGYGSAAAAAAGAAYLLGTRKRAVAAAEAPGGSAPIAAAAVGTAGIAGAAAMAATPKTEPETAAAAPITAAAAKPAAASSVTTAAAAAPASASTATAGGGGMWGWLKWFVMGLIALLAMFFLFKACADRDETVTATSSSNTMDSAASASRVTCWNGAEAVSEKACPAKVTCWDNSFAVRESACPAEPAATATRQNSLSANSGAAGASDPTVRTGTNAQTSAAGTSVTGTSPEGVSDVAGAGNPTARLTADDEKAVAGTSTTRTAPLGSPRVAGASGQSDKDITAAKKTTAGTTVTGTAPKVSAANSTAGRSTAKMTAPSVEGRICGPSANILFDVSSSTPKSVAYLGSNPQFGNSLSYTPDEFFRRLQVKYRTSPRDKSFLELLAKSLGYGSFSDMDASMFSNDTLAKGTSGLLGFGTQHALQYSTLNVNDPTHLEAFKVRSVNGTDVHFMKRCGNYMYVCQP